ncbi:MAG: HPr(Ser) kinase/phosphatase [Kofleriaceae bacterium]
MKTDTVVISDLVAGAERLGLSVVAGADGLDRRIAAPRIQKPGLALSGWPEQLHDGRVLVLGGTEIEYLAAIKPEARAIGVDTILASRPACVVVCRGRSAPAELVEGCAGARVPLLATRAVTADVIVEITAWLTDQLAPHTEVHGVLLDVLGIGILVQGKSGIGKSETALDLVVRGHRLVADDVTHLWQRGAAIIGTGAGVIRHHMEIRGLGIINIKDLFGVSAVRDSKKVELLVELVEWAADEEYERLGVDDHTTEVLGVAIPSLRLPVRPGRNLATIIEVAARNQLLKAAGHHSAREFQARLSEVMATARGAAGRVDSRTDLRFDPAPAARDAVE